MLTLKVKWIAEELLDILSEKEYEIHSTFESGFNLRVEDVLCYIGNKNDMRLPYAMILEKEDVPVLNEMEELEMDLSQAEVYSSKLDIVLEDNLEYASACEIILNLLDTEEDPTAIRDLKARISMQNLCDALFCDDAKSIQSILKKVVGYGTGLTPSGDDFLMGIIYTYELFQKPMSQTFFDTLNDMLDQGYTTDTSVHYYRCAMRSLYSQPLLDFAKGLKKNHWSDNEACERNIGLAQNALERLYTFGHTSGRDTAAGIKTACEILRKGMTSI